ncbi:NUDIX domain-containing protein [Ancylobacter pratisalsi]|uniref:ADP-ribose pyrophosphatase n=1 Tax=Ancylobacter pratisalsi TaxID=1745854 RepID=A0A6P1YM28_9HYPH|nr:NUDIX hydrolase [Ancylobacter pratisalsi]QIB33741.1 NUDIX hydrolase [Ancylobacter pratisalsi]
MSERARVEPVEDRALDVEVSAPEPIGEGFRPYHRFMAQLTGAAGAPLVQRRDIIRVGSVTAILAFDPAADCLVMIRQFRLAAHLATGKGEVVELAAGLVEPGETPEEAAHRECGEEIGVAPRALMPALTFMPSPGVSDEIATLFVALVDSTRVPLDAGAPDEGEHTRPFLVPVADALAHLAAPFPGVFSNAFVLVALGWFALNRARVDAFVRACGS